MESLSQVQNPSASRNEYFTAAPGTLGHEPTNTLVQRVDYGIIPEEMTTIDGTVSPRRVSVQEDRRAGVSEDEGRARMSGNRAFSRRASNWAERHGLSHSSRPSHNQEMTTTPRRPTGIRRLTSLASESFGGDGSPSGSRSATRTTTTSAQRWGRLKASMRQFTTRRERPLRLGNAQSAELMAELLAGAPAAILFASMFQRDELGHKRVPILLEQVKVRVAAQSLLGGMEAAMKQPFTIHLEYGSSLAHMEWTIERTVTDFWRLHTKFRALRTIDQVKKVSLDHERSKPPKFPFSAFPSLRHIAGAKELTPDDDELTAGEQSATETSVNGNGRSTSNMPRSSMGMSRKKSSFFGIPGGGSHSRTGSFSARTQEQYMETQRKQLEDYLTKMIKWVMFRPESNRMCRFLELSALGVRLAVEDGYHGKEAFFSIKKMTGLDKRTGVRPSIFRKQPPKKWFLVRHSYIVCVDSPEEMNIYDVFLVDSDFTWTEKLDKHANETTQDKANRVASKVATHHNIKLTNSERTIKLTADHGWLVKQFQQSIEHMKSNTEWSRPHRYDAFAPVRQNVYAQFLVDGRDYMWNVSRAIDMARDVIYIHDWWLSPEIYLRRPAAISQRWRLDRLLKRKAEQGVKIYVIVYRNVDSAIPIDSEYTKFSLLDLHPNIYVQRSPNQMRQGTFFWSHHEKICVVDHTVAFCGGVDLCFGRWDTPGHPLTDSKGTGFEVNGLPKDADHCQLWPGKDYSNPRVLDFYALDKPYEEMYDREETPRMPWHDIGMQIVGQPARDLSRHFIQRWNYILRQRTPSRPTPMLLPPPDFKAADLEALGLSGTCEVQILRSSGNWSLGLTKTEHSIMNAYVETIRGSEHFVYLENQFWITTLHNSRTQILNKLGDALVERIIRAHENGESWRAIIVIPLVPGYQNTVEQPEGSSVRLIMQCQYWSICRGETSIFGRLRAHGIDPTDYIEFYSLRTWSRIGRFQSLVTEQLYIHAKIMVVDDRIAIIGSANINERSLLGNRDSEIAAIVRDTDMVQSYMDGEPFMVGRFAHDLRIRLMREHLGLDVDAIREEEERTQWESVHDKKNFSRTSSLISRLSGGDRGKPDNAEEVAAREGTASFNHDTDWTQANNPNIKTTKKVTKDSRIMGNKEHQADVAGEGYDHMKDHETKLHDQHSRDTVIDRFGREVLVAANLAEGRGTLDRPVSATDEDLARRADLRNRSPARKAKEAMADKSLGLPPTPARMNTHAMGLPTLSTLPSLPVTDDTDIGGPPLLRSVSGLHTDVADLAANPILTEIFAKGRPNVNKDCMRDPLNGSFYHDIWWQVAQNNTRLFRTVFKCMPDDQVKTWSDYKEFAALNERFAQSMGLAKGKTRAEQESKGESGPPGFNTKINGPVTLTKATGREVGHLGGKVVEKLHHGHHGHHGNEADATVEEGEHGAPLEKHLSRTTTPMGTVEQWAAEQEATGKVSGTPANKGKGPTSEDPLNEKEATGRKRNVTISDPRAEPLDPEKAAILAAEYAQVQANGHDGTATANGTATATRSRGTTTSSGATPGSVRRKRAATTRSKFHGAEEILSKEDAEMALEQVQGALVMFPYDWLCDEEQGTGAWMWTIDTLAPLEIFT